MTTRILEDLARVITIDRVDDGSILVTQWDCAAVPLEDPVESSFRDMLEALPAIDRSLQDLHARVARWEAGRLGLGEAMVYDDLGIVVGRLEKRGRAEFILRSVAIDEPLWTGNLDGTASILGAITSTYDRMRLSFVQDAGYRLEDVPAVAERRLAEDGSDDAMGRMLAEVPGFSDRLGTDGRRGPEEIVDRVGGALARWGDALRRRTIPVSRGMLP